MKLLLKKCGIYDYSIYLDKETDILFAIQKQLGSNSSQNLGSNPIVRRWRVYMADIIETNPDNSLVSKELIQMFYME
mgnify:CR=1 FL=1